MRLIDLSGVWACEIPGQFAPVRLPGTLDESGVGFPDDPSRQWNVDEARRIGLYRDGGPIVTRLTRKHTFEGEARMSRTVVWEPPTNGRVFAEFERARSLRLLVNGREAPLSRPASLSTPRVFELTGLLTGRDEFVFLSDNSYPGWPRDAIVYASAASDETQTNWNGLLGYVRLRVEQPVFVSAVRVYPSGQRLDVCVALDAARLWHGTLRITSDALVREAFTEADIQPGQREIWFRGLAVRTDAARWDLDEGRLHTLTVSGGELESRAVTFGLRDFRARDGCLTLNGRRVFLRGETNCAVFPETGYSPMDEAAWTNVLRTYRDYGVNCVRFHSHCPPEAAFAAADTLGMLMQPELSHWDPHHAFGTEDARRYYRDELMEILRTLANHPSFVMLSLGNELQADEAGHACMDRLLAEAHAYDPTRLYANGSNTHYGERGADPASDFYTAMSHRGLDMRATCDGPRGWLNQGCPDARRDYAAAVGDIRAYTQQPVFSFEVGQYEVLPDFRQTDGDWGVTRPDNLRHIQSMVQARGLEEIWPRMAEATGESSLLCYRAEVEAALRTEGYSGISLLGLQDFPGQGTALIGMLDARLRPKPFAFARPERFAAFFRDVLPLALLERYTYTAGETLTSRLKLANYGRRVLRGRPFWRLWGEGFERSGALDDVQSQPGSLRDLGDITIPLTGITAPIRLTLDVSYCEAYNSYPIWVYRDELAVRPDSVYECRSLDAEAERVLNAGGTVYVAPDSTAEALPHSIQAQFSPDFWSVCTFPRQAGGMGQLIDESHPLFREFPTESYSSWQWWPMAVQRAVILPGRLNCIVTEMDSCALLRPMAKLFECRCGGGRLMFSSMGLHRLTQYPEARALQRAIYRYMASDAFQPGQGVSLSFIRILLTE